MNRYLQRTCDLLFRYPVTFFSKTKLLVWQENKNPITQFNIQPCVDYHVLYKKLKMIKILNSKLNFTLLKIDCKNDFILLRPRVKLEKARMRLIVILTEKVKFRKNLIKNLMRYKIEVLKYYKIC